MAALTGVMDIEGAIAGTGSMGPRLYRTRKQAAAIAVAAAAMPPPPRSSYAPPATAMASAARAADIASVRALP